MGIWNKIRNVFTADKSKTEVADARRDAAIIGRPQNVKLGQDPKTDGVTIDNPKILRQGLNANGPEDMQYKSDFLTIPTTIDNEELQLNEVDLFKARMERKGRQDAGALEARLEGTFTIDGEEVEGHAHLEKDNPEHTKAVLNARAGEPQKYETVIQAGAGAKERLAAAKADAEARRAVAGLLGAGAAKEVDAKAANKSKVKEKSRAWREKLAQPKPQDKGHGRS